MEDVAGRSVVGDGLKCIGTIADVDDDDLESDRRCSGQRDG